MLQGQSHDDVLELCRYVRMDPHTYKRFEFAVAHPPRVGEVTDPKQGNSTPGTAGASNAVRDEANLAKLEEVSPELAFTQPLLASEPRVMAELPAPPSAHEPAISAAAFLQTRGVVPATQESTSGNLSALAAVHNKNFEGPAVLPVMSGVGGSG